MSDCDCPELVDSSEDEGIMPSATNADYVSAWLNSRKNHLSEHNVSIRRCGLGPFLFGFDNCVPKIWIAALHQAKLLLTKNREKEVIALSQEEWEMTDLMENVGILIAGSMKKYDILKSALDLVDLIEKQAILSPIDVNKAIETAKDFSAFNTLWKSLSKEVDIGCYNKKTQFCLIYMFKTYHHHVVGYGRDGKLMEADMQAEWTLNRSGEDAEQSKDKGNKAFKENKFDLAIRWYTQAIRKNPLNHIYYGNRAQAYLKSKKYRDALCDARRATAIQIDWCKGYYRYAEAYFELGMLDKARAINREGHRLCLISQDTQNRRQLEEQFEKFEEEKKKIEELENTKISSRDIPELVRYSVDGSDKDEGIPGVVSDSDESSPPTKTVKLRKKKEARRKILLQFKGLLTEGSEAYLKGSMKKAMNNFQKALESFTHSEYLRNHVEELELIVLKYSYGIASVLTKQYKPVMDAVDKFNSIIDCHGDVQFPVAYYGLGKAYVTLNRFPEALDPITKGLAAVKKGISYGPYYWPNSDVVIPETQSEKLEKLLKELLNVSRYPPSPDAVCRFHQSSEGSRQVIYFSDPDFKGFVRITCYCLCCVELHSNCWKVFKAKYGERICDKDVLDQICPTPDCKSFIYKIHIFRQDSVPQKELVSDKPHVKPDKPVQKTAKTNGTSEAKHSKKAEKNTRKQKREDAKQQEENSVEDGKYTSVLDENNSASTLASQVLQDEMAIENLTKAEVTVLKKEEGSDKYRVKQKQQKQKKKKEKVKHILPVEVNFSDQKELLGEYSVPSDSEDNDSSKGKCAVLDGDNPFFVPSHLEEQVKDFDTSYTANQQEPYWIQQSDSEVAKNVFVFFEELLEAHGPQHIDDDILKNELEDFPLEVKEIINHCGGLRGFLLRSSKFALRDNYVCLLKDVWKAKELAVARQAEYPDLSSTKHQNVFNTCDSLKNVSRMSLKSLRTSLNPSAAEFKPFLNGAENTVSSSNSVQLVKNTSEGSQSTVVGNVHKNVSDDDIVQLLQFAGLNYETNRSKYNSLDEITLPQTMSEKTREKLQAKAILDNIDDVDDIPLYDAIGLEPTIKHHIATMTYNPSEKCEDLETFSDSSSVKSADKFKDYGPIHSSSAFSLNSATYDETMLSRCSSRSSHSELSELNTDFLYRTSSPGLQITKNAYQSVPAKTLSNLYVSKDNHFRTNSGLSSEFETWSASKVGLDCGSGLSNVGSSSQSVSPEDIQIPPHPLLSSDYISKEERHSALGSSDIKCGSGLHVNTSVDSKTVPNAEVLWPNSLSVDLSSGTEEPFMTFQERLTKQAQLSDSSSLFQSGGQTEVGKSFLPSVFPWATSDGSELNSKFLGNFTDIKEQSYSLFSPYSSGYSQNGFTEKSDWLKPMLTSETGTQTASSYISVGSNTEFDLDSFITQSKQMSEQYSILSQKMKKMEEEKRDLEFMVKQYQIDKSAQEQQKSVYIQNMCKLEQQVQTCQAVNQELENDLRSTTKVKEELQRNHQEEQTKTKIELANMIQRLDSVQNELSLEMERALKSEVEVLQLRLKVQLQQLDWTRREASIHHHHVVAFAKKCKEEKRDPPPQMKQAYSHWKNLLEKCESKGTELKACYEQHTQLVNDGKHLDKLSPINVSPLPVQVMTPEMSGAMTQMFGQSGLTPGGSISQQSSAINGSLVAPHQMLTAAVQPVVQAKSISSTPPPNSNTKSSKELPPQPQPLMPLGVIPPPFMGPRYPMTTAQIQAGLLNRPSLQPPVTSALSSTASTTTAPAQNLQAVGTIQPKNSFDKLIGALQKVFPNYARSDFTKLIQELRTSKGGSLSGMSLEEIVKSVTETVLAKGDSACPSEYSNTEYKQGSIGKYTLQKGTGLAPPPGLNGAWSFGGIQGSFGEQSAQLEMFVDEVDPCAICHDELSSQQVTMLECHHSFHNECIRQWFREQSTCPNCRVHALLPDDFPSLK